MMCWHDHSHVNILSFWINPKSPTYFASALTQTAVQCEHPQEESVGFVLEGVLEPACSAHALVEVLPRGGASVVEHRLYPYYHSCKSQMKRVWYFLKRFDNISSFGEATDAAV